MNILTEFERAKLLDVLTNAEDEVLLEAVQSMKRRRVEVQESLQDVRGFSGLLGTQLKAAATGERAAPPGSATPPPVVAAPVPTPAKNVNPGRAAIGKIGQSTTAELLASLKKGTPIAAKYAEHMKLLWARNLVTYDGKNYHLPEN